MKSRNNRLLCGARGFRGHRQQALLVGLALVAMCATTTLAQPLPGVPGAETHEAEAPGDSTGAAQLAARLAAVRAELAAIDETAASADAEPAASADAEPAASADAEPAAHANAVRCHLQKLVDLLEQQGSATIAPRPTVRDPAAAAPSVFALNELYEAQRAMERARGESEERVGAARAALEDAKDRLEDAAKARRKARTALEAAGAGQRVRAQRQLELRELAHRVAEETVQLRTLESRAAVAARDDA
jgi:hypothetical protein